MNYVWELISKEGNWACECSPRGDYRLVANQDAGKWETLCEWLDGGTDWIGRFDTLLLARTAAELWAREYEAQV